MRGALSSEGCRGAGALEADPELGLAELGLGPPRGAVGGCGGLPGLGLGLSGDEGSPRAACGCGVTPAPRSEGPGGVRPALCEALPAGWEGPAAPPSACGKGKGQGQG